MIKSDFIDNRYHLMQILGSGGMGVVYRAMDRLNRQPVALKRLVVPVEFLQYMSAGSSSGMLLSLAREFEMLASLRHPNIIQVLNYGFDEQQSPYLVMELLENSVSVAAYAQTQPFENQIRVLLQMLQALIYLHRRGILHRDLKPANVVVVNHEVKVLDFGLSVKRDTHPKDIEGTLEYMAPELFEGAQPTEASDLYALGIMAYEIFAGKYPFLAGDPDELAEAIINLEPDFASVPFPPALKPIVQRLLAKQPAERYRHASEVLHAMTQALDLPLEEEIAVRESFLQTAPFIGRDQEVKLLSESLERIQHGQGDLWLIGGESGVGKSRLLHELRIRAVTQNIRVVQGQGVSEGGPSFQLWRELVSTLFLTTPVEDAEAAIFKPFVPEIEELLERSIPDAPPLDFRASQQRLMLALADLLRKQTQPLMVVLEDLQWSADSLEPLKMLSADLEGLPILVLCSYRDDERRHLPDELPLAKTLKLERLSEADILQLTTEIIGKHAQPHVVQLLQKETEGNVFFLIEVMRSLAELSGRLEDIATITLPRSVFAGGIQQVVSRRLGRVPAEAQLLLKLSAIHGRQIDLKVLQPVTGYSPRTLETLLSQCSDVAAVEFRDGNWRFAHDKLRERVLNDLTETERPEFHQRIAQVIEEVYPQDPERQLTLARHWRVAGNQNKELHYLTLVAERQVEAGNYQLVRELAERGLEILTEEHWEVKIRLLLALAKASEQFGDFGQAQRVAESALQLAQQHHVTHHVAAGLLIMGQVQYKQGNYAQAVQIQLQSLQAARASGNKKREQLALHELGSAYWIQGQNALAEQHYNESLEIGQANQDAIHIARCLVSLANVKGMAEDYLGAEKLYQQALEVFERMGHHAFMTVARGNLAAILWTRKEFDKARVHYEAVLEFYYAAGMLVDVIGSLNDLVWIDLEQKQFLTAQHRLAEALALGIRIQNDVRIVYTLLSIAWWKLEKGFVTEGAELLGLSINNPKMTAYLKKQAEETLFPRFLIHLTPEAFEAVLERGKSFDLKQTAHKLFVELSAGD